MTPDAFERLLRNSLEQIPESTPDVGLAIRVSARATSWPQKQPFFRVEPFLSALASPWPADLAQKASVLTMVFIFSFCAGFSQNQSAPSDSDNASISLISGDFDDMGVL